MHGAHGIYVHLFLTRMNPACAQATFFGGQSPHYAPNVCPDMPFKRQYEPRNNIALRATWTQNAFTNPIHNHKAGLSLAPS